MATIAITADFTAEPVGEFLDFWLAELELQADVAFTGYNQVFQELLTLDSVLARNTQGLNVVLLRAAIDTDTAELTSALVTAASKSSIDWLVALCPGAEPRELREQAFTDAVAQVPNLYVIDSATLCNRLRNPQIHDAASEEAGDIPYTDTFFAELATTIGRRFYSLQRPPAKVIVLDCDNTLWSGVCGEDGAEGVVIDAGRAALQSFMVEQHDKGTLLCLCSKNREADVFDVFETQEMPLQRRHLTGWRINWEPKSANLRALAAELDLGLDSFVFVDDNPIECAEVQANCPEVVTINLPEGTETLRDFISNIWILDRAGNTAEDQARTAMYQADRERRQYQEQALTLADFLAGLELTIEIEPMGTDDIERVAQLTQRSNQFNFTSLRRTEAEVRELNANPDRHVLVVRVNDRFGDYGLVGVIMLEVAERLEVNTFLMSCRTLGRGVEHRMLAYLGEIAQFEGRESVYLPYGKTDRNEPAKAFADSVIAEFADADGYTIPAATAASIVYSAPASRSVFEENTETSPAHRHDVRETSRSVFEENTEASPAHRHDVRETSRSVFEENTEASPAHRHDVRETSRSVFEENTEASPAHRHDVRETSPSKSSSAYTTTATVARIATELNTAEKVLDAVRSASTRQRSEFDFSFVAPRNPTETRIAQIWATILRLDRVGVEDNFFDLGGDSLRIVALHSRLQSAFETEFPVTKTFEHPTVTAMAAFLDDTKEEAPRLRDIRDRAKRQREALARQQRRVKAK
jgi:FkbH-like protein